jgi:hypothetical protein
MPVVEVQPSLFGRLLHRDEHVPGSYAGHRERLRRARRDVHGAGGAIKQSAISN